MKVIVGVSESGRKRIRIISDESACYFVRVRSAQGDAPEYTTFSLLLGRFRNAPV